MALVKTRSLSQFVLMAALASSIPALRAQVLTGGIVDYPGSASAPYLSFGDGTQSVKLWWSINTTNKGWFYGSGSTGTTDIALATGVSNVSQITDASSYSFVTGSIGPLFDADANGGVGQFLVLKNRSSNYYGVVRIDDIHSWPNLPDFAALNATWWFQSNGTAAFSAIPEPFSFTAIAACICLGVASARRIKRRRVEP